ncbi:MAG: lipoyl synthase [Bdellovibrionales bacterium RIFOXYA1_FULL_36_14]|nr:MAG: lipoyl synthase [Bdellovibrionales bacterium RIFOXYA1_FULL_36_14]
MEKTNRCTGKPHFLKSKIPSGENVGILSQKLKSLNLHTVCEEAKCPNRHECWDNKTATMMILGGICTRGCRFCNVQTGNPHQLIDQSEIDSAIKLVETMNLNFIVITSVDRDDLADYGANHFAKVVQAIKNKYPQVLVEVLIPDFNNSESSMQVLANSEPFVIAHNIETVERLTPNVRDKRASYQKSLEVLKFYHTHYPMITTKSSIMLGLGETKEEIIQTMKDLKQVGVDILTLGQYLMPSKKSIQVDKYYEPSEFEELKEIAYQLNFKFVAAGPLVRSSYRAADYMKYLEADYVAK